MKTILVCTCLLFIAAIAAIAMPPQAGAFAAPPAAVQTR